MSKFLLQISGASRAIEQLDEKSKIVLLLVRERSLLPPIPLQTFSWLKRQQHKLHRELPAHLLELFQSRLVESSQRGQ